MEFLFDWSPLRLGHWSEAALYSQCLTWYQDHRKHWLLHRWPVQPHKLYTLWDSRPPKHKHSRKQKGVEKWNGKLQHSILKLEFKGRSTLTSDHDGITGMDLPLDKNNVENGYNTWKFCFQDIKHQTMKDREKKNGRTKHCSPSQPGETLQAPEQAGETWLEHSGPLGWRKKLGVKWDQGG